MERLPTIRRLRRWAGRYRFGLAAVAAACLGLIAFELLGYYHLAFYVFDLGIYNRHMWGIVHGDFGPNPLMGFNLLGDHAHFILLLLAPLYALWQSPETLLIIQALGIGLAGWPIYKTARYLGHSDLQAAAWLVPFYGYFGYWTALEYPFHVAALSVLPLSWALYFLIAKRDQALIIALIIAALTKEDMPLVAAMIGLYVIVLRRQWRLGLALIIAGLAYTQLVIKVWIPWVRHAPYPFDHIQLAWNGLKTHNIKLMLLSFGWLPLGALEVLMLLAPLWASRFLSDAGARWDLFEHYSANQGPILAVAAIVAGIRLVAWLVRRYPPLKSRLGLLRWSTIGLACIGTVLVWLPFRHTSVAPQRPWFSRHATPTMLASRDALAAIPADASVGVQSPFPQATSRRYVYFLPLDLAKRQPDYLLLSNAMDFWPFESREAVGEFVSQANQLGYTTLIDHDGVTLMKHQ